MGKLNETNTMISELMNINKILVEAVVDLTEKHDKLHHKVDIFLDTEQARIIPSVVADNIDSLTLDNVQTLIESKGLLLSIDLNSLNFHIRDCKYRYLVKRNNKDGNKLIVWTNSSVYQFSSIQEFESFIKSKLN